MRKPFFNNIFKLGLALVVLLIFVFVGQKIFFSILGQKTITVNAVDIEIPYGSSVKKIAFLLHDKKVIVNKNLFYWYLRWGRNNAQPQAGFFSFNGQYNYSQLADSLNYGYDKAFKITFKEGQNLVDLANELSAKNLVEKSDFIAAMNSDEILSLVKLSPLLKRQALENDMGGLEGYLFPDTYYFTEKNTAISIISTMYARLLSKLDDDIKKRMRELSLSLHELLTLASIVEKETGKAEERPLVASVYLNRLKVGMPLQADPTVVYGIKNYSGNIKKSDLLAFHPYNTYKIKGLPPGPIAAVGLEAIKACLWPAETKFLYFVAKNDGSHEFCENLACHNRAVQKWQIDYFKKAARVAAEK